VFLTTLLFPGSYLSTRSSPVRLACLEVEALRVVLLRPPHQSAPRLHLHCQVRTLRQPACRHAVHKDFEGLKRNQMLEFRPGNVNQGMVRLDRRKDRLLTLDVFVVRERGDQKNPEKRDGKARRAIPLDCGMATSNCSSSNRVCRGKKSASETGGKDQKIPLWISNLQPAG
jgi:hypothetical protein